METLIKIFLCFAVFLCSCGVKYSYYYSQTVYEKHGIAGYVKFDGKIFPVTNRFEVPPANLNEDFIFLGRAKSAVQIPFDSLNNRPVVWPVKYKNF